MRLSLFLFFVPVFFFSFKVSAECPEDKKVPGKHLVVTKSQSETVQSLSFKTGTPWKKLSSKKRKSILSFGLNSKTSASQQKEVFLVEGSTKEDLESLDHVESVQADCVVELQSNDALLNFQQWYLEQIDFSTAAVSPQREIIVAISDTGIDIDHVDLSQNIWTNQAELNGINGVDDDGNGYIDDVYGYDFADNDNDPNPSLSSDTDHGTHVAGLVGAVYNNSTGVTGISKNSVKIMALKGFASNRNTTLADLLETIYYAVDNGAHVINASWGVEKSPQGAEQLAINYAVENGVVVVAAAGNSSVPASWVVPANLENVITVAALNSADQLSTFTNYEDASNVVDFVAPGGDGAERRNESLLSTGYGDSYVSLRGTSMSSPLVAGAIGYLMSQSSDLTAFQAVFILSQTSQELVLSPYLQSRTSVYNKINVEAALEYLLDNEEEIPEIIPEVNPVSASGSRDLASSSSSNGCSGNLTASDVHSTQQGAFPFFILLGLPLMLILFLRKKF